MTQITRVADARPGDVLAVRFPPHSGDTGHVMLLDAPPVPRTPTAPLVPGTDQWDLTIIDSTKDPHGSTDTRHTVGNGVGTGTGTGVGTGVGRGTVRLYTAADGTVVGYAWSDGTRSAYRPSSDRHLVIGRLPPMSGH